MRSLPADDIFWTYYSMNWEDSSTYDIFQPVLNDGVFLTKDAKDQFDACEIPFKGSIIVGGNSFEGSTLYWQGSGFDWMMPDQIRVVFDWLSPIDKEPIPQWQEDYIIEKYFDIYQEDFFPDTPQSRFLTPNNAYLLFTLIYGDYG